MKKKNNNDIDMHQITTPDLINIQHSTEKDTVEGVYRIHLNEPVGELSNDFCKYYYASNIQDDSEFFAIVYDNSYVHPISTIAKLHLEKPSYLNKIHAYSIVELSTTKSEHLVVIVDAYEPKSNLEFYIANNAKISVDMAETIIMKVSTLLKSLHDSGIYYANICPQNIIIKDNEFFCVREIINSLPLYYQTNAYLPPELIVCHPAAREHSSTKVDSYALGVTIYASFIGKTPWTDLKSEKEYNDLRLENTTFKYLLARTKLSERFRAFFKSTLHDDAMVRWSSDNIIDWCNGKHTAASKHELLSGKNNQISFNDENYSNLKSLSYAFFNNWENALRFTKDDKLYKWASREQINNDVLEAIREVVDLKTTNLVVVNNSNSHSKLTKLFSLIDPFGSIRQMNFAISPTSIPKLLQYLFLKIKKAEYEKLIKLIKDALWEQYPSKNAIGHLDSNLQYLFSSSIKNVVLGSATRGIERLIYTLNPNTRCMSKLLESYYVTNLHEMIVTLDKYASSNAKKFVLDRHIIAFVGAKLDLYDDIKSSIFTNFPKLAEHPVIMTLCVMNLLQQHEPEIKIPNICKAITHELKELLNDNLHNVKFKTEIIARIEEAGEKGDISDIVKVLSNQQQFVNDYNGYYEACRKLKILEDRIYILSNSDSMFNSSLLLGQKVSVLASYILCLIVTVTVIL